MLPLFDSFFASSSILRPCPLSFVALCPLPFVFAILSVVLRLFFIWSFVHVLGPSCFVRVSSFFPYHFPDLVVCLSFFALLLFFLRPLSFVLQPEVPGRGRAV